MRFVHKLRRRKPEPVPRCISSPGLPQISNASLLLCEPLGKSGLPASPSPQSSTSQSHGWVLCGPGPASGREEQLQRRSRPLLSAAGARPSVRRLAGGEGLVGGAWEGRGAARFRYKYSSSRACLSASRSAWQDILQKGMLCFFAPCSSSTPSPITM